MKLRKPWQHRWAGRLGALVLRCLGRTWRVRNLAGEGPPGVYLFLHGHLLMSAYVYRDREFVTMISTHRDGEVIAQVAQRLGHRVVRGSSTRGGAKALLEVLKCWADRPVGVTPDGPRGPRGVVKPGIIQLAAYAGWTVTPVGFAASRAKYFDSWDRFTLPLPFSKIVAVLGEPMQVPRDSDRAQLEALAAEASRRLATASEAAEEELSRW